MKKGLLFLFWSLVTVGGMAGWGLVVKELMAPNERVVQVVVTEESFLHAKDLCRKYMVGANGAVFGQVALYTKVGEHLSLPCRIVVKNGEN